MTKPDFTQMTLKQLVEASNTYTGKNRKALFANKAEGVKAVEAAYLKANPPAAPQTEAKAARPPKAKAAKRPNVAKQPKDHAAKIVIKAKDCPYLRGHIARDHFARVQASRTVGDYLARFEEGETWRYARAWLGLFVRKGHVAIRR